MRYGFREIFQENDDGSITPKIHIKIGSTTMGPSITFRKGIAFGGIDIFDFKGLDIEANEDDGVLVLKGFYK